MLACQDYVYLFMLDYSKGVVRCKGTEHAFADVLRGDAEFVQHVNSEKRLSSIHAKKIISALSTLYEAQQNIIGVKKPIQLRGGGSNLRNWEANKKSKEAEQRKE